MPPKFIDPVRRFGEKIEIAENGCWLWTGSLDKDGYPKLRLPGRAGGGWTYAYRWAYEHFRGPIPKGLILDHLCRTHRCVNPWCAEPVTNAENLRRGREARGVCEYAR